MEIQLQIINLHKRAAQFEGAAEDQHDPVIAQLMRDYAKSLREQATILEKSSDQAGNLL